MAPPASRKGQAGRENAANSTRLPSPPCSPAATFGLPDAGARVCLLLRCTSHPTPPTHQSLAPAANPGLGSLVSAAVSSGRDPPGTTCATTLPRRVISRLLRALHRDFSQTSARIGHCQTPSPNGNLSLLYVTDHRANPRLLRRVGQQRREKQTETRRSLGCAGVVPRVWCVGRVPSYLAETWISET